MLNQNLVVQDIWSLLTINKTNTNVISYGRAVKIGKLISIQGRIHTKGVGVDYFTVDDSIKPPHWIVGWMMPYTTAKTFTEIACAYLNPSGVFQSDNILPVGGGYNFNITYMLNW